MREAEFRAWLEARGAKTEAGRNSRVHAVKTIEKNLHALRSPHADLAAAHADDGFAQLRERIRQIRGGVKSGSEEYRILMPDSQKPLTRLSNWNSWLAQYGRFLSGETRATGMNRDALEELKTKFLAKFPDFENGGGYPAQSTYHAEEDDYKRALLAECQPLRGALAGSIAIGGKILDALAGRQSNLLGYYKTKQRLAEIRVRHPDKLEQAVGELANSDDAPPIAAEIFLESAWPLLREGADANLPYGESRILATVVQALTRPDLAISVIYQRFHNLGMTLLGRPLFGNNPLTAEEYEDVLDLASMIFEVMAHDWNWEPRDLWDVQGFIWVTCADKLEEETTQADRIRAFVLQRYINPARARGDESVSVVVGPLNNEMGLNMAWPNICQALEGRKFQELAHVAQPIAEGPKQSTTRKLTFTLSEGASAVAQMSAEPTNLILYGPPGTGKTYHSAREAVVLCDGLSEQDAQALYPATEQGRETLRGRYKDLRDQERIGFVTFHQSYSYEDFVEGLRPLPIETEDGSPSGFELKPHDGIFKKLAKLSAESRVGPESVGFALGDRRVFKMSLGFTGNRENDYIFADAIEHGYVRLGYDPIDYSDARFEQADAIVAACQAYDLENPDADRTPPSNHSGRVQCPMIFRNWMKRGDLVIISKGNSHFRAIGEIAGDYEFDLDAQHYAHRRRVKWLLVIPEGEPVTEIYGKKFTMQSIYELYPNQLKVPALERYVNASTAPQGSKPLPHVLVIDEINRANISKVFGELITLIEPDKRLDMVEELTVELPYSGERFGVPSNLHIIGTMNTADRSIALLDTALRRRFNFREMSPQPGLLRVVDGIDLNAVLTTINKRIEYLIDREHRIGHAFFIGCKTADQVNGAMRDRVIPLLQEYFFEDWSRVAAVVGDGFIGHSTLKCPLGEGDDRKSWYVRWDSQPDGQLGFPANAFSRLLGIARSVELDVEEGE